MQDAIVSIGLDLRNMIVLTEAASGAYGGYGRDCCSRPCSTCLRIRARHTAGDSCRSYRVDDGTGFGRRCRATAYSVIESISPDIIPGPVDIVT